MTKSPIKTSFADISLAMAEMVTNAVLRDVFWASNVVRSTIGADDAYVIVNIGDLCIPGISARPVRRAQLEGPASLHPKPAPAAGG